MINQVKKYLSLLSVVCCLWSVVCLAQEQDPPLSYYEIIAQRNFFRPSEESVSKEETKTMPEYTLPSADAHAGDLTLTGIIRIKGKLKAIIEKKSGNKGFYVRVGDMVDDYEVKDIQPDGIILDRAGQITVLKLKVVPSKTKKEKPSAIPTEETTDSEKEAREAQEEITTESIKNKSNIMQNLRQGTIK